MTVALRVLDDKSGAGRVGGPCGRVVDGRTQPTQWSLAGTTGAPRGVGGRCGGSGGDSGKGGASGGGSFAIYLWDSHAGIENSTLLTGNGGVGGNGGLGAPGAIGGSGAQIVMKAGFIVSVML